MLVEFGISNAKEGFRGPSDELLYNVLEGKRVLSIHLPEGVTTGGAYKDITHTNGVVRGHTDEVPEWVSSPDNSILEQLLAEHYSCATGRPADIEDTHFTSNGPPGIDMSKEPVVDESTDVPAEGAVEASTSPAAEVAA